MMGDNLAARLQNECEHASKILDGEERNWNWHTPAGKIRFKRRAQFLQEVLPLSERSNANVIEIGAGTGTYSGAIAEAFPKLIATDISPLLLAEARRKFPHIHFTEMDAHRLDVADGSLDAVVGCSILHHLDWERAAEGFFRSLRPGGRVRFSEPNLLNPQIYLQKNSKYLKQLAGDSPDEYAFTARHARDFFTRAGFVNVSVKPFEFLHPAIPERYIPLAIRIEEWVSSTPLVAFGGSILIEGEKPSR